MTYDSGDFAALTKQAFELADGKGFAKRKRESRKRGKLRGLGIGNFLEVTAPPSKELAGIKFNADGTVTLATGTLDFGMGHATPFAQVLSEQLGIPFEKISLLQGDSDRLIAGGGSGGSKSLMHTGTAIVEAAAKDHREGQGSWRATCSKPAPSDIAFEHGQFHHRRHRPLDLDHGSGAEAAQRHRTCRPTRRNRSTSIMSATDRRASTFPNGCHIAEVEVDPETGIVEVVKYSCVNDFGTVVNPMIVAGQLHGGVVQGIGQALMEKTVYDSDGQLLTGSFMDYAMPRAADVPSFVLDDHPAPATTNPLGVKGCGEAGCAGALTSVMNAVIDALADHGIRHLDMPLTPFGIWQALQDAKPQGAATPAMTQAISVRTIRPAESRLIAGVCAAHMMSHYYMLMLAPLLAFVRDDFNVSYTELALALTVFNVVSGRVADAGRIFGRPHRRARGADRRPGAQQRRLCDCRPRRFLLGVHRDVRRRRPRQHGLSPVRLFAAVASRAAGTARARSSRSTPSPAWSARPSRR